MMLYGQDFVYDQITQILHNLSGSKHTPAFVLLVGPSHIGKWTLVTQAIQQICTDLSSADICTLHDCSGIGDLQSKNHAIKIQTTDAGKIPTLINEHGQTTYDYGIREIQSWLSIAPTGSYKILLIQHIDRLTGSASNAMLKLLEEPLDHRIIIATTTSAQTLLPTIISRAQCIHASLASDSQILSYLTGQYLNLTPQICDYIVSLSAGAIGIAHQLAQKSTSDINQLVQDCHSTIHGDLLSVYHILKKYQTSQIFDLYSYVLQSYADHHQSYDVISALTQYHQHMHASVNAENALLYLASQLSRR